MRYLLMLLLVIGCETTKTENPNLDGTYQALAPTPEIESIDLTIIGSSFRQIWKSPPLTIELSGSFEQKADSLCFYLAKCIIVPDQVCTSEAFSLNETPCSLFTFNNGTIRFSDPELGWIVFLER